MLQQREVRLSTVQGGRQDGEAHVERYVEERRRRGPEVLVMSISARSGPTREAIAAPTSVLPPLSTVSGHVLPVARLPTSTLSAAVAGPIAGGRSSAAMMHGRAPRFTFCSGPILTGYFSASTTPARQAGMISQRPGRAAPKPP